MIDNRQFVLIWLIEYLNQDPSKRKKKEDVLLYEHYYVIVNGIGVFQQDSSHFVLNWQGVIKALNANQQCYFFNSLSYQFKIRFINELYIKINARRGSEFCWILKHCKKLLIKQINPLMIASNFNCLARKGSLLSNNGKIIKYIYFDLLERPEYQFVFLNQMKLNVYLIKAVIFKDVNKKEKEISKRDLLYYLMLSNFFPLNKRDNRYQLIKQFLINKPQSIFGLLDDVVNLGKMHKDYKNALSVIICKWILKLVSIEKSSLLFIKALSNNNLNTMFNTLLIKKNSWSVGKKSTFFNDVLAEVQTTWHLKQQTNKQDQFLKSN